MHSEINQECCDMLLALPVGFFNNSVGHKAMPFLEIIGINGTGKSRKIWGRI